MEGHLILVWAGIAAFFITLIFTPWGLPIGAALLVAPLVAWAWPSRRGHELQRRQETA